MTLSIAFWGVLAFVAACGAVVFGISLQKVLRSDRDEFAEAHRRQGSLAHFFSVKLADENAQSTADFRVMHGHSWDKRQRRYIRNSALSSEAFKAVFPR